MPRVTAGREGGVKAGWVLPATRQDPLPPFAAVLTLGASLQHRDLHLLAFTVSPVNAVILLQKKGHPVRRGCPGHPQVPSPALEQSQTPGSHSQGSRAWEPGSSVIPQSISSPLAPSSTLVGSNVKSPQSICGEKDNRPPETPGANSLTLTDTPQEPAGALPSTTARPRPARTYRVLLRLLRHLLYLRPLHPQGLEPRPPLVDGRVASLPHVPQQGHHQLRGAGSHRGDISARRRAGTPPSTPNPASGRLCPGE